MSLQAPEPPSSEERVTAAVHPVPHPDVRPAVDPEVVPLTPELLISQLLRGGVLLSLSLVTCGMVMTFLRHPDYFSSPDALQRLTSPDSAPHRLQDVFEGVMAVRGQSFVMAGLLVMITVPVLRVALSLSIFRAQRDRAYAAITTGVLALLLLAFFLGSVE